MLIPKLSDTPDELPFVTVWLFPLEVPTVSVILVPDEVLSEILEPVELFHPSDPLVPLDSLYESAELPFITKIPPLSPVVLPSVVPLFQPELPLVPRLLFDPVVWLVF